MLVTPSAYCFAIARSVRWQFCRWRLQSAPLGATPAAILRAVLGIVGLWLGVGLIVGLALSLAVARLIRALLFGVSEHDPIAWSLTAAVLLFAALAAAWLPLRHATRIDPMVALRHE